MLEDSSLGGVPVLNLRISNPRFAKINYVIDNASNCENVFDLITEMGIEITCDIANALALGIMTDTGAFKHKNLTADTLVKTAKLKQKGH